VKTGKPYKGRLSVQSRPVATLLNSAARFLSVESTEAADCLRAEFEAQLDAHESTGLDLLCEHYAIADADRGERYRRLALALARDHVPYFQVPHKTRGRRFDLKKANLLEIDIAMYLKKNRRSSEKAAIEKLCDTTAPWSRDSAETLERWRREHASHPFVTLCRAAARKYSVKQLELMRRDFSK